MFERFTDRARRVVVLAQEESRLLDHHYIGTEHLLLALVREGEGIAARALVAVGVTYDAVRARALDMTGQGEQGSPRGHIPFTPRAKTVLELSLREALQLGHNYIGTEHILLGIVREGEGVAAQILHHLGVRAPQVRQAVIDLMSGLGAGPRPLGPATVDEPRRTPATLRVAEEARRLAGTRPVGTHHTLQAIAGEVESVGARALAALGVSPEVLAAKLAELETDGTTDELAEDAGARRVTVEIVDGRVAVLIDDDELRAGLVEAAGGEPVVVRSDGPAAASFPPLWNDVTGHLRRIAARLKQAQPSVRSPMPAWDRGWTAAAYTAYNDAPGGMRSAFEARPGVDEAAVRTAIASLLSGRPTFTERDIAYLTVLVDTDERGDFVFSVHAGVHEPWLMTPADVMVAYAVLDLSQPPTTSAS